MFGLITLKLKYTALVTFKDKVQEYDQVSFMHFMLCMCAFESNAWTEYFRIGINCNYFSYTV